MIDKNKEYALILSGGGARGAYEIGVWKAARELGLNITAAAGTSVGSINAAFVVMDDFDNCHDTWLSIDMSMIYGDEIKLGPLDVSKLKEKLVEMIDVEKIYKSKIEYCLVTYNMTKKEPMILFKNDIPKDQFVDYIMASANFPVFKRATIGEDEFMDGGIVDNMPVKPLLDKGWENFLVVDVRDIVTAALQRERYPQANEIMLHSRHSLESILSFDRNIIESNIFKGYHDLMKVEGQTKGCFYYIKNNDNLKGIALSPSEIQKIKNDTLIKRMAKHKSLVLASLALINNFSQSEDTIKVFSDDFFMVLLEYCAKMLDIKIDELYDIKELEEAVYSRTQKIEKIAIAMQKRSIKAIIDAIIAKEKETIDIGDDLMLAAVFAYSMSKKPPLALSGIIVLPQLIVYSVYTILKSRRNAQ